MNSEFKVGDRLYLKELGSYFTLSSYDKFTGNWRADWGAPSSILIIPEQLETLRYFHLDMIKVKDDKHLLELQLRHG